MNEKIIGKSGILTLNLNNNFTLYLAICNLKRLNPHTKLSLENIKEEIIQNTPFFSSVIFGSYATGKQQKDSDLDIAIFIESEEKRRLIEASINTAKLKSILNLDLHVISKNEMLEMLTNKEENLGKQIARKHLTFYNHQIFYVSSKKE